MASLPYGTSQELGVYKRFNENLAFSQGTGRGKNLELWTHTNKSRSPKAPKGECRSQEQSNAFLEKTMRWTGRGSTAILKWKSGNGGNGSWKSGNGGISLNSQTAGAEAWMTISTLLHFRSGHSNSALVRRKQGKKRKGSKWHTQKEKKKHQPPMAGSPGYFIFISGCVWCFFCGAGGEGSDHTPSKDRTELPTILQKTFGRK